jgi:hypothetical protein
MSRSRWALLAVVALALPARAADVDPGWTRLMALVGDWEAAGPDGTVRVSYRLVSSGTALLETIDAPDSSQMVTVYHPDGDALLLTHFCSSGNQSRMRARSAPDGTLDFGFVDATNVESSGQPPMSRLVLSFPAADRLVQEWTLVEDGGRAHVGRHDLARKR